MESGKPLTGEHLKVEIKGASRVLGRELVSQLFRPSNDHGSRGLGSGYAAAREILRRQRGSLAVSSEPGQGTSFTLTLPAASRFSGDSSTAMPRPSRDTLAQIQVLPAHPDAPPPRPKIRRAPSGSMAPYAESPNAGSQEPRGSALNGAALSGASGKASGDTVTATSDAVGRKESGDQEKIRILVMDDEQSILALLTAALRRLGFDSQTTKHGQAAIDAAAAAREEGRPFSLAIIDLTIPGGMGGIDAAEALGQLDPELLLIASSGYAQNPALVNFQKFGFHDVLVKPYRIPDLAKLLKKHLPMNPV